MQTKIRIQQVLRSPEREETSLIIPLGDMTSKELLKMIILRALLTILDESSPAKNRA